MFSANGFDSSTYGGLVTDFATSNPVATLKLDSREDHQTEAKRTGGVGGMGPTSPTGLWVEHAATVTVQASNIGEGTAVLLREGWFGERTFPVKNGTQTFELKGPNFIMMSVHSATPVAPVDVRISGTGLRRHPLYVLGETTQENWKQQLAQMPRTGSAEPDVMLYAGSSAVLAYRDPAIKWAGADIVRLLEGYNRGINAMNHERGLDQGEWGEHGRLQRMQMFVPRDVGYMFATGSFLAYHKDIADLMLDPEQAVTFGGIYHEIGHHMTPGPLSLKDGGGEYAANVMAWPAMVGNTMATAGDSSYEELVAFLRPKMTDELQARERSLAEGKSFQQTFLTTCIAQLKLSVGPDVMRKTFQLWMAEGKPASDAEGQMLLYWMSKANDIDLRPFFKKWGLTPTAQTNAQLDALKLSRVIDPAVADYIP